MEQIGKIALAIILVMALFIKVSDKTKDTNEKSSNSLTPVKYIIAVLSVIILLTFFAVIYR